MKPEELPAAVTELRELLDEMDRTRAAARAVRRLMPRRRSLSEVLSRGRVFVLGLHEKRSMRVDLTQLPPPTGGPRPGGGGQ